MTLVAVAVINLAPAARCGFSPSSSSDFLRSRLHPEAHNTATTTRRPMLHVPTHLRRLCARIFMHPSKWPCAKHPLSFGRTINIQSGAMVTATKEVRVKRIYETPSRTDGTRVLVDRLWP